MKKVNLKKQTKEIQDLLSHSSLRATEKYLNAEVAETTKETPKNDASFNHNSMETAEKYLGLR